MDFDELHGRRSGDGNFMDDMPAGGGYELSPGGQDEGFGFDDEKPAPEYEIPDEPGPGEDESSGGFGFADEPDTSGADEPGGFGYDAETEVSGGGFGEEPLRFQEVEPTSFFGFFGKGLKMAMLKGDAAEEVAADPKAFVPALVIFTLPSLVVGALLALMMGVFSSAAMEQAGPGAQQMQDFLPVLQKFSYSFVIIFPLLAILGSLFYVAVLHLFAKIFKGEGRYLDYYQTVGVGSLVSWGGVIPYIGMLFSLWMIPVTVVITSRVHNISTGRAVAVVLLPIVIAFIIVIALFSTMMMALMGAGGMGGMQGM